MNMYVTSDLHFNHKSILKFCASTRPFADLDDMKACIVDEINNLCNPLDTLYHLGDLYFGKSLEELREILSQIKCRLHFIRGNHDHSNHVKVMEEFGLVDDYIEYNHNGTFIIMSHYPMTYWNKSHYGSVHLFAHMHGSYQSPGRSIDVGYDAHGRILSLEEAITMCNAKPIHKRF